MKKTDYIIISAGLVLALLIYAGVQWNNQRMDTDVKQVEIYIDGKLLDRYPLSEPGVFRYDMGEAYNVVEISGGAARITHANCPTQSCIRDGAIDGVNETVVCLPHRFHIQITGAQEVDIDAISQ